MQLHSLEYFKRNDSATQGARVVCSIPKSKTRSKDMLDRSAVARRDQECVAEFAIRWRGISKGLGATVRPIHRVFCTSAHL